MPVEGHRTPGDSLMGYTEPPKKPNRYVYLLIGIALFLIGAVGCLLLMSL